jgi:hypothetical protein
MTVALLLRNLADAVEEQEGDAMKRATEGAR